MNKLFVRSLLIQVITAISIALIYQPTFANDHRAMASSRIKKLVKKYKIQAPADTKKVTIILNDRTKSGLQNIIKARGGTLRYKSGDSYQIQLPANQLDLLLNSLPDSITVRLPYPHKTNAITSQGVEITGAKDMHDLLIDGAGIKIGVIDMGFTSLSTSQAAGELPTGLSITDYTGTGTDGTNHGTNVAEIVHDMAPGADLYLAKINSNLELEAAVNDMIAAGVQVINHSIGWFGAAFYDGTGPFCDITNTASAADIIWANAAGNDRQNHYLGTFTDTDSDLLHEFSTGQNYNTITVTSGITYTFILNWDAYPETTIDYDLFLYNGDPALGGSVVESSTNAQSGRGFSRYPIPNEILSYTATYTGTLYIVVKKKDASTPNLPLTLFSINKALGTRTNSSSLSQPGDCASSLTVGATDLSDVPEYFSSMGPTTDGRNKPDVTGPDRVITSLSSSFTGTSAAAPNVAGAVALLIQQNPSMTNADIYNLLTSSPYDIYTPGFDIRTGYGRISLDADSDLFNHDDDNCVINYNPIQLDTDLDSQGNACDTDDDNDGLLDTFEVSIGTNTLLIDTDGDTISDFDEVAFDGIASAFDPALDLNPLAVDTDGDSLLDNVDPIPITFNFNDGDLAPLGAPDGQINAADYMIAERMSLGKIIANDLELSHGDLYPQGAPDGIINISDMILIRQLMN